MNKAILIGRMCADPEMKQTQGGIAYCNFRIACNRPKKDENGNLQADFLPVVAWRQTAELCGKYLARGMRVGVIGSIRTRSYDAQDGSKRYVTEILAEQIEFLEWQENNVSAPVAPASGPTPQEHQMGFTEVNNDELPF